ncbi:MAG: hypothetical protein JW993_20695 [Sedimentisphaerales bacterium]|nr:hypothetical protein [Sedimentisphaerales bacterium]
MACKYQIGMVVIAALLALFATPAPAKTVAVWDFAAGLHGWIGNRFVEDLRVTDEGVSFVSTGIDPWIEGPALDMTADELTRVTLTMTSTANGSGELFYGRQFQAGRSVRFVVQNDGQWHEYVLMITEPLETGARLRLDPAAGPGRIVVRSIRVESLPRIQPPTPVKPKRPNVTARQGLSVSSGGLALEHSRTTWGDFMVKVGNHEMASGYQAEQIGLVLDGKPKWLRLDETSGDTVSCVSTSDGSILCTAILTDSESGRWRVSRRFAAGPATDTITIETQFTVDREREVVYLPWLTIFPGLGTFGQRKTQALFAGLEYLADEPSSSTADITTPEHVRRAPDPVKATLPLMALAHEGRYIGLIWEPSDTVAALIDSPDTIYGSNAHVMALNGPAVGTLRFENDLVAHTPFKLAANETFRSRVTLIGGTGDTVVPAIRQYVALKGLPEVPQFEGGFDAAVTLLAHGWLDSDINADGLYRHAVWGSSFGPQPAADAPMYMDWLASHTSDADLAVKLGQGRDLALSKLPMGQPYLSSVSHVRTPAPPLVFGRVEAYVRARRAEATGLLNQFDENGIKRYRAGNVDYGKTHFADHANGLAAADVARILEAATLSADLQLTEQALTLLDKQTALYADTVPRGAQTWEVPLHTPDILASAHLVKAYTLGFLLSGRPEHLDQARYWAWTGVPFVYLYNPTTGTIGPYATIAVLGATNWQAPVWFGRPVQWCGLVYASALHSLSRYDPGGPWRQIAQGITATGLQMSWPATDEKRQGLLPDIFELRAQYRDGPAIIPGTVQAHVPGLFGQGRLYDVRRLGARSIFVHAPCTIRDVQDGPESATFVVEGWPGRSCYVLVSGLTKEPSAVTVQAPDAARTEGPQTQFDPDQRLLVVSVTGTSTIGLRY